MMTPDERRAYHRAYYQKHRTRLNEANKARNRKKGPEARRAYNVEYRKANPHRRRVDGWKARGINITFEEYEQRLKLQDNKCAICKHVCKSGKQLAVDHCHDTGKTRGLLCSKCNVGIGMFKTREEWEAVKTYLWSIN